MDYGFNFMACGASLPCLVSLLCHLLTNYMVFDKLLAMFMSHFYHL